MWLNAVASRPTKTYDRTGIAMSRSPLAARPAASDSSTTGRLISRASNRPITRPASTVIDAMAASAKVRLVVSGIGWLTMTPYGWAADAGTNARIREPALSVRGAVVVAVDAAWWAA